MTQNNEKVWLPMADARAISGMTSDQITTCCQRKYLEYQPVGKEGTRKHKKIELNSLLNFCVETNPLYKPRNEAHPEIVQSYKPKKENPQKQKIESNEQVEPTNKTEQTSPSITINSDKVADLTLQGDRNSAVPIETLGDMYSVCSHDLAAFKEALDMFFGVYQFETHTGITATLRTLKYAATLLHSYLRDMSDLVFEVADLHFAPVKEGD